VRSSRRPRGSDNNANQMKRAAEEHPDYAAVLAGAKAAGLGPKGLEKWEQIVAENPARGDEPPRRDVKRLKDKLLKRGGKGFTDPDWMLNEMSTNYVAALLDHGTFINPVPGQVVVVQGELNSCWENAAAAAREHGATELRGFALDEDGWWLPHAIAYSERTGHIYEGPSVLFVQFEKYYMVAWQPTGE